MLLIPEPEPEEREGWKALATEPRLDMLPTEALVASIHHLAQRLLELTDG